MVLQFCLLGLAAQVHTSNHVFRSAVCVSHGGGTEAGSPLELVAMRPLCGGAMVGCQCFVCSASSCARPLFFRHHTLLTALCRHSSNLVTEGGQRARPSGKFEYGAGGLLCFRHNSWPLEGRQQTCSKKSRKMRKREEHRRNEAQDHWERVVLTELGHIQARHGFDTKPTPELPHPPERCRGRCRYTP